MKIIDDAQCDTFYQALIARATEYAGVFYVGVRTTGIFCISTCRARKPKRENVEFYSDAESALAAGFRPCKICRPTENASTAPAFVENAINLVRQNPQLRVSDQQLRAQHISPEALRRWFLQNHGMTFHTFQRMLRVNTARQELKNGRSATDTAFDSGYDSLSGFGYIYRKLTGGAPRDPVQAIVMHRFTTPLGPMFVCATERGVCLLEFVDRQRLEKEIDDLQRLLSARVIAGENQHTRQTQQEIGEYFAGSRQRFEVALDIPGSDLQRQVWRQIQSLEYGTTTWYQAIAQGIGNPAAVRAVASTIGANRVAIIIPCHRIIAKDGTPGGYAGGLARKKWLLEHEQKWRIAKGGE